MSLTMALAVPFVHLVVVMVHLLDLVDRKVELIGGVHDVVNVVASGNSGGFRPEKMAAFGM